MKYLIGILVLVILWFTLPFIGISPSLLLPNLIEWVTKFILPWIVLYWIIRLVKALEIKK